MAIGRALLCSSVLVGLSLLIATCTADSIADPIATQLVFETDPADVLAGTTLAPIVVEAQDASGNLVIGFGEDVTLSIETNPGGGTLVGTTTVTAVGGIAIFDDLMVDLFGAGYRLRAEAGSLTSATSAAFDVIPALAAQHIVTVGRSGFAIQRARGSWLDGLGGVEPSF